MNKIYENYAKLRDIKTKGCGSPLDNYIESINNRKRDNSLILLSPGTMENLKETIDKAVAELFRND